MSMLGIIAGEVVSLQRVEIKPYLRRTYNSKRQASAILISREGLR